VMTLLDMRRLRFVAICGVVIAASTIFFAAVIWYERVSPQKNAVAGLEGAGAIVLYDFEYDFRAQEGRIPGYKRPSSPSPILLAALGKDWVARPVYIQFTGLQFGDRELGHSCDLLVQLPTVRHLNLRGTQVSDQGIGCLKRLQQLTVLDVRRTGITPLGANALKASLPTCLILF